LPWVRRASVERRLPDTIFVRLEERIPLALWQRQGRFVVIDSHDHATTEIRLVPADRPDAQPIVVLPRTPGHEYGVEHWGDDLVITTNSAGAEDFRIVTVPIDRMGDEAAWRELVPHVPGRLILETVAYAGHLVRLERADGLPRIVVRRRADGAEHTIAFDEEAYSLGLSAGYEFDTTTVRFTYSSMTTPAQVYDYDMETRARVLRKTQEIPSGHDPAHYVTRRLAARATDGEMVPISVLYRADTPLDGTAPLLLYGYGSYGISIPASFSTTRLSLVDRGFVYAIAHIRGGKDKGYRWYTDGKHKKKPNTFTDFIAAGEHLVAAGYTRRGRIVANGGSAGGMLMGAVANMAPDLFLGLIADVPFVDVLNTMLDASLPLTPPEWPEWGNPIESAEDFAIIRSYSPYDNVAAKAYPHILAFGGLTDPRVTYWEPAKWVARLRERKTDPNLLILKINMEAGHGGASGRFEQLKEIAFDYAFALKIAGEVNGSA
jgi:oligopeptidase B